MRIEKKLWPKYFKLIQSGIKTYDFRLADFEINPGDTLVLREWNPETQDYTGQVMEKHVTYVGKTKGSDTWPQEEVDRYGYQIISFK